MNYDRSTVTVCAECLSSQIELRKKRGAHYCSECKAIVSVTTREKRGHSNSQSKLAKRLVELGENGGIDISHESRP